MTDLQAAYQRLRDAGRDGREAVREMAAEFGLDVKTVRRMLDRAAKRDSQRSPACSTG